MSPLAAISGGGGGRARPRPRRPRRPFAGGRRLLLLALVTAGCSPHRAASGPRPISRFAEAPLKARPRPSAAPRPVQALEGRSSVCVYPRLGKGSPAYCGPGRCLRSCSLVGRITLTGRSRPVKQLLPHLERVASECLSHWTTFVRQRRGPYFARATVQLQISPAGRTKAKMVGATGDPPTACLERALRRLHLPGAGAPAQGRVVYLFTANPCFCHAVISPRRAL